MCLLQKIYCFSELSSTKKYEHTVIFTITPGCVDCSLSNMNLGKGKKSACPYSYMKKNIETCRKSVAQKSWTLCGITQSILLKWIRVGSNYDFRGNARVSIGNGNVNKIFSRTSILSFMHLCTTYRMSSTCALEIKTD